MAALHLLMTCRCSQKVRFQAETQIQTAAAPQWEGLYPTADVSLFSPVLCAIKEDSEKVPTLLTDYILKGNFDICHSVQQIIKEMKENKMWALNVCSALQSCVLPKAPRGQGALCVGDFLYSPCCLWPCAAWPPFLYHHQPWILTIDMILFTSTIITAFRWARSPPPILHYKLRPDPNTVAIWIVNEVEAASPHFWRTSLMEHDESRNITQHFGTGTTLSLLSFLWFHHFLFSFVRFLLTEFLMLPHFDTNRTSLLLGSLPSTRA